MFIFRQVLVRFRAGDSVREIARTGLMGRDKLGTFRLLAEQQGWLAAGAELPDDASMANAMGSARRASSTISHVEPYRERVTKWLAAGRWRARSCHSRCAYA